MDIEKFKNSPTGQLVRTKANYWAFIPNPLPPGGVDKFSTKLVAILSEADRGIGALRSLGKLIPNSNLLVAPYILNVLLCIISLKQSTHSLMVMEEWDDF